MVYGVLRFINFAHGDVFMLGAFAGYFLAPVVNRFLPATSYIGGAVVLALSMVLCAPLTMILAFPSFRPLPKPPKALRRNTAISGSPLIEHTRYPQPAFNSA